MYRNVMVAVDNSECSNFAVDVAVNIGRLSGSTLTGHHVFAAELHDSRFRHLEPGLPERYQKEEILRHQREVHDDLIGRGLRIISDSYLTSFEDRCQAGGISAHRTTSEGRNYVELVRDARESGYDLVVIGAHGLGRVDRSILGSVCERVARLVECDVLVVREGHSLGSGPILVAIDGSPHSFGALAAAINLARLSGSPLSAVAAYDPYFHTAAFRSVAEVLSDEHSRLFRFQEQARLHDEIIDVGLMGVYRSHLEEGQRIAAVHGLPLGIEVLEGKPFDVIASHAATVRPSLLVVGRVGIHHAGCVSLGSTAENLLRFARCNVLVVNRAVQASSAGEGSEAETTTSEQPITWAEEAEVRLKRVPPFVRNMVRKRLENVARQSGRHEITPDLFDQVRHH